VDESAVPAMQDELLNGLNLMRAAGPWRFQLPALVSRFKVPRESVIPPLSSWLSPGSASPRRG
jgi:hypothetical protein